MIDDDLPSDLRELFAAERGREAPAPSAKARVHHALAASVGGALAPPAGSPLDGAGAAAGAGSGAGGAMALKAAGGGVAKLGAAKLAAAGGSVAGGTVAATGAAGGGALGKGLAIALAVTMAGSTATGVYLAQQDEPVEPTRELIVDTELPPRFDPAALGAPPPAPPSPAPPPVLEDKAAVLPRMAAPPPPTPAERAERLAAERRLLDEARAAVARGEGDAALGALEAHGARFPDGQLVEEREALAVLALAKLGRADEAQAKARRFLARWPQSLFAGAVRQAAPE